LRALHCGGELRSPGHGRPQDTPTIETILLVTFYEIIKDMNPTERGKWEKETTIPNEKCKLKRAKCKMKKP